MAYQKLSSCALVAVAALLLFFGIDGSAQESSDNQQPPHDHSCTVDAAGAFALPKGKDEQNFDKLGWGLQAGGGFAVTRSDEPDRGNSWYITGNFMYEKFKANAAALLAAEKANHTQLANATAAHGGFTTVTLDPTFRHAFSRRFGFYGSGGFGWLRRGIGFNGANPATLLLSGSISLDRLASNSGVFDLGGGTNFGPRKIGGFMLFAEARVYRGLAINNASTLVPLSLGLRW
jgi:hypothetical protein